MARKFRFSRRALWAESPPISDLMARALSQPQLVSLAAGFVDQQTLPVELVQDVLSELLSDARAGRAALQYGTTPGDPELREAILALELEANGRRSATPLDTDRIVVTAGSNQLLHLVGESLLDQGDIVLAAAPTYLVLLGTLQNLGARTFGVAADEAGMVPEALDETLRRLDWSGQLERVKLIYLVTYFDNPRGVTMPLERKAAIVDAARRWSRHGRIYVAEDAAYRSLRYAGDDVPSALEVDERAETVLLAGTFSKCFSPGIRVGWGILPSSLVGPVCNQKGNIDFGSPHFGQALMARVLRRGLLADHVQRICQAYREKLDAMLEAADKHLAPIDGVSWVVPRGGLYLWVVLPEQLDAGPQAALFARAIEQAVLYVPGQYCFPSHGEPVRRNTMRLSFGVQTVEGIRRGIEALASAIRWTEADR